MSRGAGIYIVTRVHGLRTHLITSHDIGLLAKAKSIRDIADSLMKTEYATELSQLPTAEQDAATLENIFLNRLVQRFFFVRRVAQGKLQDLLTRYCARFEVENIKRVIRAKHGNVEEEPKLIPLPREYSLINFPALVKAKDIEEVASLLRDTPYHTLLNTLPAYAEARNTLVLEATLDKIYFSKVWELARKRKGVRDLIGREMDLRNLLLAMALKKYEASPRLIEDAMIPLSYNLPGPILHSMIQSRLEDAPNILPSAYSKLVVDAGSQLKGEVPVPLEWFFSRQLYGDAYASLRSHPLQAGYIIAYLLLCECEAKNLVSIVTGKQLNLSEDEISKRLFGIQ